MADGPGADLTAIWGSDALLDLLAERQLSRPLIRRDPALAVLSVLATDVDGPAAVTGAARRAAARQLAAWRARRLALRQAERLAARQAERLAARDAEHVAARKGEPLAARVTGRLANTDAGRFGGPLPERVAARHADLAARAAATREATSRARLAPAAYRPAVPDRGAWELSTPGRGAWDLGTPARGGSVTVAAIVGSLLAALALAAVAAGSTGLVAASLLARVARVGTGAPAGSARRAAGARHGRPGHGPRPRLRPPRSSGPARRTMAE